MYMKFSLSLYILNFWRNSLENEPRVDQSKLAPTECLDVGLAPELVSVLALRVLGEVSLGQREVGRGEADLPALLHRVNATDVLSEVGAGGLGTVTFILKISNILKYFNTLSLSLSSSVVRVFSKCYK